MTRLSRHDPCPVCGRYENRPVGVDALIAKNNQLLLIKRGVKPYKGRWALPGGHIEWDETTEQSLRREVKEETGLEVKRSELLGTYSNPGRHPRQAISLAFAVRATGAPKSGGDVVEVKFFAIDKLPKKLAFDHQQTVGDYLRSLAKTR